VAMLQTFFNLAPEVAERVMGSAGTEAPTTPNPNPSQEHEPQPNETPVNTVDEPVEPPPVKSHRIDVVVTAKSESREDREDREDIAVADQRHSDESDEVIVFRKSRRLPQGEKLVPILRSMFREQAREVNESIEKTMAKAEGDLPPRIFFNDDWTKRLADQVQPIIQIIAKDQGHRLLRGVGAAQPAFDVFDRNIPKAAAELSLKFAESTNATTSMELDQALTQLRQEVSDGLIEGDTRVELRKRVEQVFDKAEKSRAAVIARTEASRASHQAELMSAKDSGVIESKVWLLSGDACPICEEIAAQNPSGVALDKTFAELGGEYGSIDGPPAHPNCQCSLTYEIHEESLAPGERIGEVTI
jgi:hypothetical protein